MPMLLFLKLFFSLFTYPYSPSPILYLPTTLIQLFLFSSSSWFRFQYFLYHPLIMHSYNIPKSFKYMYFNYSYNIWRFKCNILSRFMFIPQEPFSYTSPYTFLKIFRSQWNVRPAPISECHTPLLPLRPSSKAKNKCKNVKLSHSTPRRHMGV